MPLPLKNSGQEEAGGGRRAASSKKSMGAQHAQRRLTNAPRGAAPGATPAGMSAAASPAGGWRQIADWESGTLRPVRRVTVNDRDRDREMSGQVKFRIYRWRALSRAARARPGRRARPVPPPPEQHASGLRRPRQLRWCAQQRAGACDPSALRAAPPWPHTGGRADACAACACRTAAAADLTAAATHCAPAGRCVAASALQPLLQPLQGAAVCRVSSMLTRTYIGRAYARAAALARCYGHVLTPHTLCRHASGSLLTRRTCRNPAGQWST